MNHEIKSGEQVIATITARQVLAFQISITGDSDTETVHVPVWANTIAIDADGAIWAYESTAEEVRIFEGQGEAWCDVGNEKNRLDQIGAMTRFHDWEKSKIDLRGLK